MVDRRAPPDPADPKGLVREAFRIDGITEAECRSIFVDWALSVEADDHRPLIELLLVRHAREGADHPMCLVLSQGLDAPPRARRRGGRKTRVPET